MKRLAGGVLLLLMMFPVFGKIYYSKTEAMVLAFGEGATVEMLSLFPDDNQVREIENKARVKLESNFITFYVGKKNGRVSGYAAIESHTVRTKPETLLIVLSPSGDIAAIHTLAFHEPPEYQPPQRWYQQLLGKALPQLSLNTDIQGISGATLSTRSALKMARKVKAVFEVMVKGEQQ